MGLKMCENEKDTRGWWQLQLQEAESLMKKILALLTGNSIKIKKRKL